MAVMLTWSGIILCERIQIKVSVLYWASGRVGTQRLAVGHASSLLNRVSKSRATEAAGELSLSMSIEYLLRVTSW
jgi:hypothetical protein